MDLESITQFGIDNGVTAMKFLPLGAVWGAIENKVEHQVIRYSTFLEKLGIAAALTIASDLISSDFELYNYTGAITGLLVGNFLGYEGSKFIREEIFVRKFKK